MPREAVFNAHLLRRTASAYRDKASLLGMDPAPSGKFRPLNIRSPQHYVFVYQQPKFQLNELHAAFALSGFVHSGNT